ncbi:MAG: lipid-A-disaccharide synthase [Nitrospiraceae bacterium]|nr:lipid-A-disaccharide synthase [Nitrospiraceae bacterium]
MTPSPISPKMSRNMLIVTGEPSGDQHGARLCLALKEIDPSLAVYAVGGANLRSAGAEIVVDISELSVMGLFEVAKKLPVLLRAKNRILEAVRIHGIRTAVLIDFSGFNLRLAKSLKAMGVRIFYYVSPQVWASRKGRVRKIRELVDHMFVIFPFERDFYEAEGIPVTFVGHPLLDESRPAQDSETLKRQFFPGIGPPEEKAGETPSPRVIGLLPGSRESEIGYLYPRMLAAFDLLRKKYPNLRALVPQTPHLKDSLFASMESVYPWTADPDIFRRVPGRFREVTKACDVAIVTSGTATLETALLDVPMVVVYVMHPLSYQIAKRLVTVPAIGMVNLVAGVSPEGGTAMPELIQGDASPERIFSEVCRIFSGTERIEKMREALSRVQRSLGEPGASGKAASEMARLLGWTSGGNRS